MSYEILRGDITYLENQIPKALKSLSFSHVQPGLDTRNSVIRVSENDLSQDFDNNNDA